MISLRNLSKSFSTKTGRKWVVKNIDFDFPDTGCVALLGRNGVGKSTLLGMIAGSIQYDEGEIIRSGSVSWPIGFAGSFHPQLTGVENVRFIARIYGIDSDELVEYTRDFAELDQFFDMPLRTYSSGMRSRLAFGVSMGVPFDTYLIDEVTSVGDSNFKHKCDVVLKEKLKHSSAILVSHSLPTVRKLCTSGILLNNGQLRHFENIDQAINQHNKLTLGNKPAKQQ